MVVGNARDNIATGVVPTCGDVGILYPHLLGVGGGTVD